jgi:hypothetical protein
MKDFIDEFGADAQPESEHGLEAAFTTIPDLLSASHNIWRLPRLVCGHDWKSSEQLAAILTPVAASFSAS